MRKTMIYCAVLSCLYSSNSAATICVDPTAVGQMISQTANDSLLFVKEQAQSVWKDKMDSLRTSWQTDQEAMRDMTATQKTTEAISETANRNMQAKYMPSPTVCDAVNTLPQLIDNINNTFCDSFNTTTEFEEKLAYYCDPSSAEPCDPQENADHSGLEEVMQEAVDANGNVDTSMLSVAPLLANEAGNGKTMTIAESKAADIAIKNMMGSVDLGPIPVNPDGSPIDSSSSADLKAFAAKWHGKFTVQAASMATVQRVLSLKRNGGSAEDNDGAGKESILGALHNRVMKYNSADNLKTIANAWDKSAMIAKRAEFAEQEEFDAWFNSNDPVAVDMRAKITNADQVLRMQTEMDAFQQMLILMLVESSLNIEFHTGLQTQILNEINSKS